MTDFIVNDMTCGGCASNITRVVKKVDPSAECNIDLGTRRVRVTSSRPSREFFEAIKGAGFAPTPFAAT